MRKFCILVAVLIAALLLPMQTATAQGPWDEVVPSRQQVWEALGGDTYSGQEVYEAFATCWGYRSQPPRWFMFQSNQFNVILGTANADVIMGTAGPDLIISLGGDDEVHGKAGIDFICTGEGDDVAKGGDGSDIIDLGPGDDEGYGNGGNDDVYGGNGADLIWGGPGNDRLANAALNNELGDRADGEADRFKGGAGKDAIEMFELLDVALGGPDDDIMLAYGAGTAFGQAGDDELRANGCGDISFWGGPGVDFLGVWCLPGFEGTVSTNGGSGNDTLQFSIPAGSTSEVMGNGGDDDDVLQIFSEPGAGADGVVTAKGGDGDDVLEGGEGSDRLIGDAGNDTLSGLGGDDLLLGGSGDDEFSGGPGTDGCWSATEPGDVQDGTCEKTNLPVG